MSAATHDIFLSYARADAALAKHLLDALKNAGLSVWFDDERIEDFDEIQRAIRDGVAQSRVLVALYSRTYPERRACDWELAAAYLAGGLQRTLVLNPESTAEHVEPKRLRKNRFAQIDGHTDFDVLAKKIKDRVLQCEGPIGSLGQSNTNQVWVGISVNGGPRHFVGRQREIWQIHDGLANGSVLLAPTTAGFAPADGTAVVQGLGGVGKSLLAEEYARRFASAWPGGIFWLRAGGGATDDDGHTRRASEWRQVAAALGVDLGQQAPADVERTVKRVLADRPGTYLWVVDDLPYGLSADDTKQWFAPTAGGHTLLTTRDRGYGELAETVTLAELSPEEGYQLLTARRSPVTAAELGAARDIVRLLGGHALALAVASHLVSLKGYEDLQRSLESPLEKDVLELADRMRFELPNGHHKSIARTFLQSIQLLGPDGQKLLSIAAVLAPAEAVAFDMAAAALALMNDPSATQSDKDALLLAVDDLGSHSLCEVQPGSFTVHELVCRAVLLGMNEETRKAARRSVAQTLSRGFARSSDLGSHAFLEKLLPHALYALRSPESEEDADLLLHIAAFFSTAGAYGLAVRAAEEAVRLTTSLHGADDERTLFAAAGLGQSLKSRGLLKDSHSVIADALSRAEAAWGRNSRVVITLKNNLAEIMLLQGHTEEAITLQEQVYRLVCEHLEEDDEARLSMTNHFATMLMHAGDFERARDIQKHVVELSLRQMGPLHSSTLVAMTNYSGSLLEIGKYEESLAVNIKVLLPYCEHFRERHPYTINLLAGVMAALASIKNVEYGADSCVQEILQFINTQQSASPVAKVRCALALAQLFVLSGSFQQAANLQGIAVRQLADIPGTEPLTLCLEIQELARILGHAGKLEEARMFQEAVLSDLRREHPEKTPLIVGATENLATILSAVGELSAARTLREEVVRLLTDEPRCDESDRLAAMARLADIIRAQEDWRAAVDLIARMLPRARIHFGAEHEFTLTATLNYAVALWAVQDSASAIAQFQSALVIACKTLEPQDPRRLRATGDLAECLVATGDPQSAIAVMQVGHNALVEALGEDAPEAIELRGSIETLRQCLAEAQACGSD